MTEAVAKQQHSQGSEKRDGLRCKGSDKENKDKDQRKNEIERKWREILRENNNQKKEVEKGEKLIENVRRKIAKWRGEK